MTYFTGAVKSKWDKRNYKWSEVGFGSAPFDWDAGFLLDILNTKDQQESYSCFHGKTQIVMEDFSTRDISKITVGEYVISHLSKPQRVIKIMQKKWQGTSKKIYLRGEYQPIECTLEHPILGHKRQDRNKKDPYNVVNVEFYNNKQPRFIEAKNFEEGDWVAFPFNRINKDLTIYTFEKDPDFLWLLGLYMAEGCTNKYGITLSLHKDEYEWYERIKVIMDKYGTNTSVYFKKDDLGMTVNVFGRKWVKIFSELGGNYCESKRLATRLLYLDPKLQMHILKGVSDGDGHARRNTITIKSTSIELLRQMRLILLRNKVYSSICKEKKYNNKKQAFTLEYSLTSKTRYSFVGDQYIFVQIKNIIHCSNYRGGFVYNLEVENDNTYQVNGLAVHNCGGQAMSYYGEVLNKVFDSVAEERSAKFIYSQCYYPTGGAIIDDLCKVAKDKGWGEEVLTPSNDKGVVTEEFMRRKEDITEDAFKKALNDRALAYTWVSNSQIDTIAQAAQLNHGAIVGITGSNNGTWLSKFPSPDNKRDVWNHWLFVRGAKKIDGVKYIIVQNSWGDACGENGTQYLSEEFFTTGKCFACVTLVYAKPVVPTNHVFNFDMYYKTSGNEVKMLQDKLKLLGFMSKTVPSSGYYGDITKQAIKDFQAYWHVASPLVLWWNGGKYVGKSTRVALNKL